MADPFLPPADAPHLDRIVTALRAGRRPPVLAGLSGSAAALHLFWIGRRLDRPLLVLFADDVGAEGQAADLRSLLVMTGGGADEVALLPSPGTDPYLGIAPHPRTAWERVETLGRLRDRPPRWLFTTVSSLLQPLPPPGFLSACTRTISAWEAIDLEPFQTDLEAAGYTRVDLVTQRGEWSRRGGVVDVHPAGAEWPVRMELFGEQVESIRTFDPATQRSRETIDRVRIAPMREMVLDQEVRERLISELEASDRHSGAAGVESRAEALRTRGYFMGVEALVRLGFETPADLFDYVGAGAGVVVHEPDGVEEAFERIAADRTRVFEEDPEPTLPPPARLFFDPDRIRARLPASRLELRALSEPGATDRVHVAVRTHPRLTGGIPDLLRRIGSAAAAGWRQVVVLSTSGRARRLEEILAAEGIKVGTGIDPGPGGVSIRTGALAEGFELPDRQLALYNEAEIFGAARRRAPAPRASSRSPFRSDFRDLNPGDLVVHVEHGIGRFMEMKRIAGNGEQSVPGGDGDEFLVLEYRDRDRLYLPILRLDLLQRYTGSGGTVPKLDRLGGRSWEKTRVRVRKAMQEMAEELLKLYAARKAEPGILFNRDTSWQRELEDAFPFEETPDQERAIAEVKADMEKAESMDRLLCGDVGFGKTEVALRATFKAVMDGRQVAVLVPTTVLAYQHDRTFRERFAAFPVRVDMLSRFRGRDDQRRTLLDLADGKVDVVIGTHRLLSKDIRFRNLGLLVIDEEQRFGVKHKERIQTMRKRVDVLTMTATPIPRTLQMSLAGIRDLSIIETPPRDRLAIQTNVVPFREGTVAAAIRAERDRGGQIYFVHNRVESIASMAHLIRRICPEIRIGIAHGQMRDDRLEQTMLAFVQGEFDLLLTTTIIENGLDIPNVNTLIVNRADRFGLAQLYQLRGRVGRSHHRAFAYFLVPSYRVLTEKARKRLRVLQEFTELGSGFRIAAMDLEIRGAGHVLGGRQHGHIAAVGFDTYARLLENAVRELKGEEVVPETRPELNLRVDYTLPDEYIDDSHERLRTYKRISSADSEQEIEAIRGEVEDRFGRLPPSGEVLVALARLRLLAAAIPVRRIDWSDSRLRFRFGDLVPEVRQRLVDRIGREAGWRLTPDGILAVPAAAAGIERVGHACDALKGLR